MSRNFAAVPGKGADTETMNRVAGRGQALRPANLEKGVGQAPPRRAAVSSRDRKNQR